MGLSAFLKRTILIAGVVLIAQACGGEEAPATTAVPTAAPSGVAATVPPATQAPKPASTVSAGSGINTVQDLVTKAPRFAPVELDNVRYGGTFRLGTTASVLNWDPITAPNTYNDAAYIYEKLIRFLPNENDAGSHLGPGLAESWKISDDFKTYTLNLRKGVKFHNVPPVNGREFTSDDAVFSYRRYMEIGSTSHAFYRQVESIEAADKYTIVIKLKEPNAWAFEDLFRTSQSVIPRELIEQPGGIKDVIIGTGPYIVKSYAPRIDGLFVRNPNYWDKDKKGNSLPYTDDIRLTYVPDPGTSIAGMRTGQLDSGGVPFDSIVPLVKSNPEMRVFRTGEPVGTGIGFNTTRAPWNDVRVRRALSMVFDRQKTAEVSVPGGADNVYWSGPIPWSAVSDEPFKFEDYGPYYKYDPEASKKLLIEAGFPDGKLVIPGTLVYFPNYAPDVIPLQAALKQHGITLPLEVMDLSAFSLYNANRQIKDLGLSTINTPLFSLYWGASNEFLEEAPFNNSFVRDPEIRKVVFQIRTTTDPAKLRGYAKTLWDFDTQGVWRMWYARAYSFVVYSGRTRNFTRRSSDTFAAVLFTPWLADAPRTQP